MMHAFKSLALIGLRGSGKTSLGTFLAKKLDFAFFDTDEVFKNKEKRSIAEFVAQNGWATFRQREEEILSEMPQSQAVISCGGGIVLREKNRLCLKQSFFTVFLDVPVQELVQRLNRDLKKDQRPAFTDKSLAEEMSELHSARLSLYLEACHYRLQQHEGLEREADLVLKQYADFLK